MTIRYFYQTSSQRHDDDKMVLSVLFYTLLYMEKTLSTTESSPGYRPHTKVGVVTAFSSCHQLCLVKKYQVDMPTLP